MKLVDILQGKWLGHPLHPAIVHLPMGAWPVAAVLDVLARHAGPDDTLPRVAAGCVCLGLLGAVLAVPTGVADWSSIKREKPAWTLGLIHMGLNILAAAIWAANLGLRWTAWETSTPVTVPVIATSVTGAVLVLVSGYLGTLMVFDHGVGIARESKKKWRRIAARGGARLPETH